MIRKILSNTVLVLSVALLILALYFSFNKDAQDEMFILGHKPFIITSGSMEPDFPVNALVVIKRVDPSTIEVGDTIAFFSPSINANVFHRVVGILDEGFVTKGDNNQMIDFEMVAPENLVGVSVFHTTLTVYILNHFQSPIHFVVFVIVLVGTLSISIHFFRKYITQKKGENP